MLSHRKSRIVRVGLLIVGFVSALTGPPWLPVVLMGIAFLRYTAIEMLVLGVFIDMMWLPALPIQLPLYTVAALVLLWGLEPLRRQFLVD